MGASFQTHGNENGRTDRHGSWNSYLEVYSPEVCQKIVGSFGLDSYLGTCECYPMFQKTLLSKITSKGHALLSEEEVFGYILQQLPNHVWNARYFWQFLWLLFQDDHLGKFRI